MHDLTPHLGFLWKHCPRAAYLRVIGIMALITISANLFAATPVLSRLEVIGSGRGLALTLGADAAFDVTIIEKPSEKSIVSTLSITCSNVIYGLDDYQFSSFPRGAPIRQIVAKETRKNGGIELLVKTLIPLDKNIRFKQKDNRWVILLTSAPINDFAWSAQNETKKNAIAGGGEAKIIAENNRVTAPPSGPPRSTASSFLEDITILHREQVETIIFKFDAPTEMIVKSMPEQITILFVNAKNGLPSAAFTSEKDWLVKTIELKEVIHGGAMWLAASIDVNRAGSAKPLIQTFSDRLVIYSVRDAKRCLSLWSAKNGTTLSYDFITPQEFPVDLKNIENKALSDSKNDMSASGTFSVQTTSQNSPQFAAPPPPRVIKIIIVKDNTALRSRPSTAPVSAVIRRFPLGAIATQLGKKGAWIHVEAGDAQGWVLGSLTMDSTKVPQALWRKIEAAKIAAAKQEEKLQEAERLQQEKIEKVKSAPAITPLQQQPSIEHSIAASSPGVPEKASLGDTTKNSALLQSAATIAIAAEKPQPPVIAYNVLGRDPFLPLTQDEEGPLPSVENLQMVGILYDKAARIALFEDINDKANAYALRENDPVKNGYLLRIQSDKVLFLIKEFGISRTFTMKLNKGKQPELLPDKEIQNPMNSNTTQGN
jgi:hypothetical protein